ncbi:AKT-interacting protein-like [Saccoglossus kowalevskii]|uniref:AKT-interacting protein-like n=1 Tax=Saccoglossus kowalevskii TaxID=10224 RepID=A0ABM0MAE3_SACKO|nr:PREDICTED: AKT-interacting protein-like [Saccoglossus kowalevskii]
MAFFNGSSVVLDDSPGDWDWIENITDGDRIAAGSRPFVRQSSGGKKQLPAVPDAEAQFNSQRMIEKRHASATMSNGATTSYGPFFLEYSLLAEYNQLLKQRLPGVYVLPSARSALLWFGVLFIRQGLYQEGVFKFTLTIPENYPDGDCPRLVFDPPVYHPIIDAISGELDVKRTFTKWKRNVNHIWQVLLYARRIFYKIDTKNPSNPEAAVLYEQDLDLFRDKVAQSIEYCRSHRYDPPKTDDPHEVTFSQWDPEMHAKAKDAVFGIQRLKQQQSIDGSKNAQTSGLSWVQPGTMDIFSKDDTAI